MSQPHTLSSQNRCCGIGAGKDGTRILSGLKSLIRCAIYLAVSAIIIALRIRRLTTVFEYRQKANGLFRLPVFSIVLVSILTQKAPVDTLVTFRAPITGLVHVIHRLHGYPISFAVAFGTLLLLHVLPKSKPEMIPVRHALI